MNIKTTTNIFGSFSESPGNNGATFFNAAFQRNAIDAIYLPVKCSDTEQAITVMNLMNFQGASFSKPHKVSVISFLDEIDDTANSIGAVNTVVRTNKLIGYNTDWIGVYSVLQKLSLKHLFIYGKGGFSAAAQYACSKLNTDFTILNRNDTIPTDDLVLNATPVDIKQDNILDGRPSTNFGFNIFEEQAKVQYQLYTGLPYE